MGGQWPRRSDHAKSRIRRESGDDASNTQIAFAHYQQIKTKADGLGGIDRFQNRPQRVGAGVTAGRSSTCEASPQHAKCPGTSPQTAPTPTAEPTRVHQSPLQPTPGPLPVHRRRRLANHGTAIRRPDASADNGRALIGRRPANLDACEAATTSHCVGHRQG
ncbi:hypothetical protein CCMA1212_008966 [Trichoderma ghanense]|uniref:Uncharacterized protein n=1 Tax=Trichoderma ghanense TaxID=65468 RepID=A0ABY2GV57_9HYPO